MKRAATGLPPTMTGNPVPPLNTVPVGPPGTATSSAAFVPAPSYSVELLVAWFATHHGVVGPAVSPQALTSLGSCSGATSGWSETSGVTVYPGPWWRGK